MLQWVYGNIVNVHAEDYEERRRELTGPHSVESAQAQQLGHLAAAWRRMFDLNLKKHELNYLRRALPAAGWKLNLAIRQCIQELACSAHSAALSRALTSGRCIVHVHPSPTACSSQPPCTCRSSVMTSVKAVKGMEEDQNMAGVQAAARECLQRLDAVREGMAHSTSQAVPAALASLDHRLMGHGHILECVLPLRCTLLRTRTSQGGLKHALAARLDAVRKGMAHSTRQNALEAADWRTMQMLSCFLARHRERE